MPAGVLFTRPLIIHSAVNEDGSLRGSRQRVHSHGVHHWVLITKGDNLIYADGEKQVKAGDLIVLSPHVKHCFQATLPGEFKYSEITFKMICSSGEDDQRNIADILKPITSNACNMDLCTIFHPTDEARLTFINHHSRLMNSLSEKQRSCGEFSSVLFELFTDVASLARGESVLDTAQERVKTIMRQMERSPVEVCDISSLCRRSGISRGHFFRIFKRLTGKTPLEYHTNLRLDAACTLLENTEFLCKEIAEKVGFSSSSYFNRVFKARFLISPEAYRKSGVVNSHLGGIHK